MATKAEVRQRVGEDLALVPIGQSLEAQDQARIDAAYAEMYERLKDEGLAAWAFAADVPTKLVPYFSLLIEEKLLTSYSVPESRYLRIKTDAGQDGELAMKAIASLVVQEHESVDNPTDY